MVEKGQVTEAPTLTNTRLITMEYVANKYCAWRSSFGGGLHFDDETPAVERWVTVVARK